MLSTAVLIFNSEPLICERYVKKYQIDVFRRTAAVSPKWLAGFKYTC